MTETNDAESGAGVTLNEYYTIPFAGVTAFDNFQMEMPESILRKLGIDDRPEMCFSDAIRQLPTATTSEIEVANPFNPGREHNIPISTANAVVNPELAEAFTNGEISEGDSMVYAVSSERYTIINPVEAWSPWADAFEDADLNDAIIGEFRVYDFGRKVHGDIYLTDELIHPPGGRQPLYVGIQTGNSFDGSMSLYARGFAYDTQCDNSFRALTEKLTRRHVGQPSEYHDWIMDLLDQMGAIRDYLLEIISEALDIEMDFSELPYSVSEYYQMLGLPEYLANAAAQDAKTRSQTEGGSHSRINKWVLHSGLTYALTHSFRGKSEDGSLEDYYFTARRILDNPAETMEVIEAEYERRERRRAEVQSGGELSFKQKRGLATVERYSQSLRERKSEFEAREERINNLLMAMEEGNAE